MNKSWLLKDSVCDLCEYEIVVTQGHVGDYRYYCSNLDCHNHKNVEDLYQEARRATSAGSHTAAVLCCRKLLMHIAVSKGAKPGETFASYVNYLSDNNYVPPGAKEWVDHIREIGNEANHEINIMKPDDSKDLIKFSEMLLKIIFEFPATVQKRRLKKNDNSENNSK